MKSLEGLSGDQMVRILKENPIISWLDHPEQEYKNTIFVIENLGKPEMRKFNPKFGHVDLDDGSNIFSFRMNPEVALKDGKVTMDTNTNVRVLMCVDAANAVHILKVYRKISAIDREGFSDVERGYYKEAKERAAKRKIACLNPLP